jgi:uncharacterized protein (UPF0332 family)
MTLPREDKIQLIQFRINKSDEAFADGEYLLSDNRISASVNRLYYSVFYLLSALSIKVGFSTSKHKQLLGWFNKNYVHTGIFDKKFGKLVYTIFENREKSDYDFLYAFTLQEAKEYFTEAAILRIALKKEIAAERD